MGKWEARCTSIYEADGEAYEWNGRLKPTHPALMIDKRQYVEVARFQTECLRSIFLVSVVYCAES